MLPMRNSLLQLCLLAESLNTKNDYLVKGSVEKMSLLLSTLRYTAYAWTGITIVTVATVGVVATKIRRDLEQNGHFENTFMTATKVDDGESWKITVKKV